MRSAVRAELLKLRTTRTALALFAAMIGLVLLAVLLHGLGLPAHDLAEQSGQRRALIAGESVGVVFAALLGALSVTTELRHGTLRPTLLAQPNRPIVVVAKAITTAALGLAFGLVASSLATAIGSLALHTRTSRCCSAAQTTHG